MRINDAQKKVDDWIKKYGVRYFNELTNMSLLMEEVGELARIFSRKFGEQSFKNDEEEQNMADEMADVLFVLICLANQTGVNLEDAFKKNLGKKSNRDEERHHLNKKLL
jgi:NTP pyrophosphatase (non-canonical NTP hydrolase)